MKPIKVLIDTVDEFQVTFGYLIDFENAIVFDNGEVWLTRVKSTGNDLFEVASNMSLLGEAKETTDLEDYAKRIVKHLMKTSLFDYIVQKHFYDEQDINFRISEV